MTLEENKRIARQAFTALMERDLASLGDLLTADAVLHQCGLLDPISRHAIMQGDFPRRSLVAEREDRLECIIGEGDMVALHWRTSGRFSDPHWPERNGNPVNFPSMSFIRMQDGKIAEIWNIQDVSTMHTQHGES